MANEEQLAILRQGVEVWNEWRKEDSDPAIYIQESLFGGFTRKYTYDLSDVILPGVNLQRFNLGGGNLSKANLRGTNLNYANLRGAYLKDADLSQANLGRADLSPYEYNQISIFTDLSDADLTCTVLHDTILKNTILRKTNLRNAHLQGTIFRDIDLSNTVGLDKISHDSPSIIDIDTLRHSWGKISAEFLRGCGLSDWEIESAKLYQEGLSAKDVDDILYRLHELRVGRALQYYSVFISYSMKDQEFAQRLYDDLQDNGVRCWFAPEDVQGGKKLHEQIDGAIRTHDRLLLVLSEHSMNSEWVKTEIANARQKEVREKRQVLFPISLVEFEKIREWKCFDADTGKDSAREIREYFIPDFSQWREQEMWRYAFERLLKDLRAREGENGQQTTDE